MTPGLDNGERPGSLSWKRNIRRGASVDDKKMNYTFFMLSFSGSEDHSYQTFEYLKIEI